MTHLHMPSYRCLIEPRPVAAACAQPPIQWVARIPVVGRTNL